MAEAKTVSNPLPVKKISSPKQLRMSPKVFAAICETIGTKPAETGGILGGSRETGEVTHFFFDEEPRHNSGGLYVPNNAVLNNVRKTQWKPAGIAYLGSIHSHPPSCRRPSQGDEVYARRILEKLAIPYLLIPIVETLADTGSVSLYPFAAVLDEGKVNIIEQELVVGGSLIRPAKPIKPNRTADAEACLLILLEMELNLNSMLYGSLPWAGRPALRQRHYHYHRKKEFDYD